MQYPGSPTSDVAQDAVRAIRDLPAPAGAEVLVGGRTATDVDLLDGLRSGLPWMALLMATAIMVLLFFAFGSVVLPVKAVAMNLVSIGAAVGVVVWGFQDGHLADLLGFTATGFIQPAMVLLMLAVRSGSPPTTKSSCSPGARRSGLPSTHQLGAAGLRGRGASSPRRRSTHRRGGWFRHRRGVRQAARGG